MKRLVAAFLLLSGLLVAGGAKADLFVSNFGTSIVGSYSASTGAAVNANLVSGTNNSALFRFEWELA